MVEQLFGEEQKQYWYDEGYVVDEEFDGVGVDVCGDFVVDEELFVDCIEYGEQYEQEGEVVVMVVFFKCFGFECVEEFVDFVCQFDLGVYDYGRFVGFVDVFFGCGLGFGSCLLFGV